GRAATRRARRRARPPGRRGRRGRRGYRAAAGTARGPRGSGRAPGTAARGDRAHVLRRPVAIRHRGTALPAPGYREVPGPARHAATPCGVDGGPHVNQRPDHEEIDALLALRALGGIEPDDDRRLEAAMATHGPQCPECRRLERAHAEVAARLAVALDPSELPDGLEDRVVSELRRSRPRPRRGLPIRRIAAVAAAAVLAFAAGWAARGIGGPAIPETLAGSRVVVLRGSEAHLSVAYRPGRSGAFLFGSDLPAAPSGRVYELWIIRGGRPIP